MTLMYMDTKPLVSLLMYARLSPCKPDGERNRSLSLVFRKKKKNKKKKFWSSDGELRLYERDTLVVVPIRCGDFR